jgi:hypothetical protein
MREIGLSTRQGWIPAFAGMTLVAVRRAAAPPG